MTRDEFIGRVAADTDRTAQDALAPGRWDGLHADSAPHLVLDIANALSGNPRLSKRTQAHRLETLLRGLSLRRDQVLPVAQVARAFPAHLRMAVANAVPAEARLELYGSRRQSTTHTSEKTTVAPAPIVEPDDHAPRAPGTDQEHQRYSTVLLLSHPDRQDGNRKLLEDAELDTMVVEAPADLEKVLATSTEVCGCAIDRSALAVLDTEAQEVEYSARVAIKGASLRFAWTRRPG